MAGCLYPRPNKNEHLAIGESIIPKGNWTPEAEKALISKLDRRILGICFTMMFIGYLDRQNIANAPVLNIGKETGIQTYLGLKGLEWNVIISIYGIGLFLFEPFSNILQKKFSAPVWFARIMISWGIITMCQSQIKNFAGAMVCRFMLGVAESGLLPGVPYYLAFWYTQGERGVRMSFTYAGLGTAGILGGFLAIACQNLDGRQGILSWQWLFIIEGIPAVVFGLVVYFFLPRSPQDHKGFLTPEEEEIAIRRLPPNAPSAVDKIVWEEIIRELKDPVFWLFAFGMLFIVIPVAGASALLGLIVAGMGFNTPLLTNAFAAAVNGWSAFYTIGYGWHSDWTQERYYHILFTVGFFALVGTFPLALTASNPTWVSPPVRLFFLFVASCIPASYPITWAYRANTSKGTTSGTVNSALTITMYAGGLVLGPWIYPATDAPYYVPGFWGSLGLYLGGCACIAAIPFVLRYQLKNAPVPTLVNDAIKDAEKV